MHITSALCLSLLSLSVSTITYAQNVRREVGNLVMEGIPAEIPARITDKLSKYDNVRSADLADWAPDGKGLLISTRFGEAAQLHRVSAPGAYREQLTFYKEPIGGASSNPAGGTFLFSKDVGGTENYQLYTFNLDSRQITQLTDGKSRHTSGRWSKKGDQLAWQSNQRNGTDMDLYLASAATPTQAKMLLQVQGGGWGIADWSKDGSRMLVVNGISINESLLYVLDVATGKLEQLNVKDKKAETIAYNSARFTADGKGAYIVSDEGTEFATLRYYDFQKKSFTPLTADIKWEVQRVEINDQGTQLTFVTNEDGYSKLYLLNTATNKYEEVKGLPKGVIGNIEFNPDGSRLALSLTTSVSPSDVYVLGVQDRKLERWTFSETGGLNPAGFTEPELVRYPTFDQDGKQARQIPAFIYRPKNATGKVPVLVNIHGGPEGQSTANFSSTIQYLVNELGIAVVVPNVRGSSGYGKNYLKLDNGFLRENSVKDIGSLLDWIAKQPNLDAGRVAVMGGSYGGYMTLACMTNFNDRLRAGIDVVGISNFVTFLKNTSDYRRDLRRVEYGDERDPKMEAHLQKISPNNNVKKITKPMFIIQGKNDPRVPVTEAEQMVEALKKNGNPTWYLMAKDEGHGFRKKSSRDFQNAATMLFLEQFVTGSEKGAATPGSGK